MLVLVAGGIGVTPMVAILRHIMHQLAARLCAKCNTVSSGGTSLREPSSLS